MVLVARQRDLADRGAGEGLVGELRADLAVADLHDVLVAGVGPLHRRPRSSSFFERASRAASRAAMRASSASSFRRTPESRDVAEPALDPGVCRDDNIALVALSCCRSRAMRDCSAGVLLVAAHGLGDLGEIARAGRRHDRRSCWSTRVVATAGSTPGCRLEPVRGELRRDRLVERGHAVVVEAARLVPNTGISSVALREELAVALLLLAHVAQRVLARPCGRTC